MKSRDLGLTQLQCVRANSGRSHHRAQGLPGHRGDTGDTARAWILGEGGPQGRPPPSTRCLRGLRGTGTLHSSARHPRAQATSPARGDLDVWLQSLSWGQDKKAKGAGPCAQRPRPGHTGAGGWDFYAVGASFQPRRGPGHSRGISWIGSRNQLSSESLNNGG